MKYADFHMNYSSDSRSPHSLSLLSLSLSSQLRRLSVCFVFSYFSRLGFLFFAIHFYFPQKTLSHAHTQMRTDTHAVAKSSFYVAVVVVVAAVAVVVAATILVIRFWPKFQFLFDFSALFAVVVAAASSASLAFSFFPLLRVYFNAKLRQTRQLSRSRSRTRSRSQSGLSLLAALPGATHRLFTLTVTGFGGAALGRQIRRKHLANVTQTRVGKAVGRAGVTHCAGPASN